MQKWAPARKGDFRQEGSGWAFAAPVAAFKAGNLDAVACLEVTEEDGITIAWLCENPSYLGVPGNSIAWLVKGIETLVGKRLDMAVQELPTARGELADDDEPQASPKK
ncbi:hypothetical protein JKP88DRAFT_233918 [Tribonema minus]|uniref:Uncharacterized protein n=1 Tax=Tribonema minus TaxID=303371 RepID=A0A835Z8Z3_9STRA|nr:hypothetical protein JKP88DRAFT_233918 [Tribonema minus]